MNSINLTEFDVIEKLTAVAKAKGVTAPRAITVERTVLNPARSLQRRVKIALIVPTNSEPLIDALIQECLSNNNDFYFIGSEVNLQGNVEIDYLLFEAKIMGKK